MGATVSSRAEYDDDGYMLRTPGNKSLLEDMGQFVREMNKKNPGESTVVFDRSFQWCTDLRADDFAKPPDSEALFVVDDGNLASKAKTSSGAPCLVLSKVERLTGTFNVHGFLKRFVADDNELGQIYEIRCWTFQSFQQILDAAGDKEAEIKLCLEANTEPVTSIMGPGHVNMGTGSSLLGARERVLPDRLRAALKKDPKSEELDKKFRLCLLLNAMDGRLLAVHGIKKQARLTPELVDRDLEMIRMYSGRGRLTSSLVIIEYSSELMFADGTRAPIRRQPKGDICFLTVNPHDGPEFSVGCNVDGFYFAKDPSPDGAPPPVDDMTDNLRSLLRIHSKHFSQTFGREGFMQGTYAGTLLDRETLKQTEITREVPKLRKRMLHQLMMRTTQNILLDSNSTLGPAFRDDETLRLPPSSLLPSRKGAKSVVKTQKGKRVKIKLKEEKSPAISTSSRAKNTDMTMTQQARLHAHPQSKTAAKIDAELEHERREQEESKEPGQAMCGKGMGIAKFQLHMDQAMSAGAAGAGAEEENDEQQGAAGGGTRRPHSRKQKNRVPPIPLDPDYASGDSSAGEDEESDNAELNRIMGDDRFEGLPTDYWTVTKLIKDIKRGNTNATVIILCLIADFGLTSDSCLLAFKDSGAMELLVNLLAADDDEIKIGSLRILKEIARRSHTRRVITESRGIGLLANCIPHLSPLIMSMAAGTLARVAASANARRQLRRYGAIDKFTGLLRHEQLEVKKAGALGLWRCSLATKNKSAIFHAKTFSIFGTLLSADQDEDLLVPVVGTIQECTIQARFQLLMRTEGMVPALVQLFNSSNLELRDMAASAVFRAGEQDDVRQQVREHGGLPPLTTMLASAKTPQMVEFVTGALYQCCHDRESISILRDCRATDYLAGLIGQETGDVLLHVSGALGLLAQDSANRRTIRKSGAIVHLVHHLTGTNECLLTNVSLALRNLATDLACVQSIDEQDGVRCLWSLLKSPSANVRSGALLALCPCVERSREAGGMVRSFVGGLGIVTSLLKSPSLQVLSSVCALITHVAMDDENLSVITDHNIVTMLSDLTKTMRYGKYEQFYPFGSTVRDPETGAELKVTGLRKHLSDAIASCCNCTDNRETFAECKIGIPLVSYLTSPDECVRQATCCALYQLSRDATNCVTLQKTGVVRPLLKLMGSQNEVILENAACCIRNIRLLALTSEQPDRCYLQPRKKRSSQQ